MKNIQFALGSFLFVAFLVSSTSAQAQRTFVSASGNDGNPCSRTAPCRTLGQALSQTNPAGEVYVLDSAGYGPVTITKGVTIVASQGITAGISVFSGDGIDISAGPADAVVLRGLTINNQGSTGNGIAFNSGGRLHVEDCVVAGFTSAAGRSLFGQGGVTVSNSTMRGNGDGINVHTSGILHVAIDRVRLEANRGDGLLAQTSSPFGPRVVVYDSLACENGGAGFDALNNPNPPLPGVAVVLDLEHCIASNNNIGVLSKSSAPGIGTIVRVSNCLVTDNNFGLEANGFGAVLFSRGNNTVEENGISITGTQTYNAR
jgi:hypothetical protein